MTVRHALLCVEGPTDQAVVGRALALLGFRALPRKDSVSKLDPFWAQLKPTWPKDGDLYARLDMPSILSSAACSVAVYCGDGTSLRTKIPKAIHNHDPYREELDAFGIIADADANPPGKVAASYQSYFRAPFPDFPDVPGRVVGERPKLGVFVLPDNASQGVVEHLVLECGNRVYPGHLERAKGYVDGFDPEERKREKWAPFDEQKALIAAVASVLKPGKTNTATLADNDWISARTQDLPMLAALMRFLVELLSLESAAA